MEWVETTGRTVEEAKDAALDQLGVDEQEADFEVLEEPRTGLFGRTRGEARVRARVRPRQPRAKVERGNRRRRSGGEQSKGRGGSRKGRGGRGGKEEATVDSAGGEDTPRSASAEVEGSVGASSTSGSRSARAPRSGGDARAGGARAPSPAKGAPERPQQQASRTNPSVEGRSSSPQNKEQAMTEDVTLDEQAEIVEAFLDGLVDAFGLDAEIRNEKIDDETIELDLVGDDLGLLIGPKGRTLWAIQELSRTVVQRQATGTHHGRVRIDVGGYRQRRKEALQRFTQQVAAEVQTTGVARSLEPMGAADRKIVHDTVNEMDGIATTSEGEEPRRCVVIVPAD